MSGTLKWKPIKSKGSLPDELRFIFENKYSFPVEMSSSDVSYIEGLRDAGIKSASDLLELLEKYPDGIELDVEY